MLFKIIIFKKCYLFLMHNNNNKHNNSIDKSSTSFKQSASLVMFTTLHMLIVIFSSILLLLLLLLLLISFHYFCTQFFNFARYFHYLINLNFYKNRLHWNFERHFNLTSGYLKIIYDVKLTIYLRRNIFM